MIYLKLAWRNMFRNKRRTYIAGTAIAVGLAALMITDATMIGMRSNLVQAATAALSGQVQMHANGYRTNQDVDKTIRASTEQLAALEKDPRITHAAPRVLSFGMITSATDVSQVMLYGIDPGREKYLSQFDDVLQKGRYLDGSHAQDIVIGSKLAERLAVELGDHLVVTVAQAGSGALAQEMFRVSGIYHFNIAEIDGGIALIDIHKAQQLLAIGPVYHEIAMNLKENGLALTPADPFWRTYNQAGCETVSWTILFPQLKAAYDMSNLSLIILGVILFAIISLGIINTLFMSIYERMFEFGVIRAVGTRPWGIRRLVVFEAGALGILSAIMGTLIGTAVNLYLSKRGLDYRGLEYVGVSIRELIYPKLALSQYMIYPVLVFVFTTLVGIYPALYAARMSLTKAMRRAM